PESGTSCRASANQDSVPPGTLSLMSRTRASSLRHRRLHSVEWISRPRGGSEVSTFVLIPGAGGVAWYWHRVVPLLPAAGHEAIAVDLPGADDSAGLPEYADIVTAAIG